LCGSISFHLDFGDAPRRRRRFSRMLLLLLRADAFLRRTFAGPERAFCDEALMLVGVTDRPSPAAVAFFHQPRRFDGVPDLVWQPPQ
jgi:hypothetical protein